MKTEQMDALVEQHRPGFAASAATERKAAVERLHASIVAVVDAELAELQRCITETQIAREHALTLGPAHAEAARAAHGRALIAEYREAGPRTTRALIVTWRAQPNRADAIALRELFQRFDQRAQHELGDGLAPQALAALLAESIIAQPNMRGGVNATSSLFGVYSLLTDTNPLLTPLTIFCHRARTSAEIEAALLDVESELTRRAQSTADAEPDPDHVALFKLHTEHATARDLRQAQEALARRQDERRREAARAAVAGADDDSSSGGSLTDQLLSRFIGRGQLAPRARVRVD